MCRSFLMKGVVMNNIAVNYGLNKNYQQPAFKGGKNIPQKIIKEVDKRDILNNIKKDIAEQTRKSYKRAPFVETYYKVLIRIAKGLYNLKQGINKVDNIFKK